MELITLDDIINASFRKATIGGYRPDDVDSFLDEVQASYDHLLKENAELMHKLEILAKKVEEYREEEESIRNTLMNAQKLADASVREAKHKAEVIVNDAMAKAEKLSANAQSEVEQQRIELERLQSEVVRFRSRLLTIYKEHLTLIDALPSESGVKKVEEPKEQQEEAEQPAAQENAPQQEEPVKTEEPSAPATEPAAAPQEPAPEEPHEEATAPRPAADLKFGGDHDNQQEEAQQESPRGLFK